MELADYLTNMGITPVSALLIAFSVWLTAQYFKYKIAKIRDNDKKVMDFLAKRLEKRSEALEEINSLVHDFDHYVNHLFEGDKGWYETELETRFKDIRSKSRECIEVIEGDFPEFLDVIYAYTDAGLKVGSDEFDYQCYKMKKTEQESLFTKIRSTLPGMNIITSGS